MGCVYIKFALDLDNGEAYLTRGSKRTIDELPEMLAADLLWDVAGEANSLYEAAMVALRGSFYEQRSAAGRDPNDGVIDVVITNLGHGNES